MTMEMPKEAADGIMKTAKGDRRDAIEAGVVAVIVIAIAIASGGTGGTGIVEALRRRGIVTWFGADIDDLGAEVGVTSDGMNGGSSGG